jgi:adenylylsulfate kinase-like enzyme
LYKKARKGEIKDFTGISAPYEPPSSPSIVIKTLNRNIDECGEELFKFVLPIIKLNA